MKTKPPVPETKYTDDMPDRAYELMLEGLTVKKLAVAFGVDRATVYRWMKEYPDLCDSIKRGRDDYDSGKVEKSLRQRAMGYRYTEVTKELSGVADPKTGKAKLVITKKVRKEVAPDSTSMIFWLKNRQPDRWRDVKRLEHGGLIPIEHTLSDEDKELVKGVAKEIAERKRHNT